MARPLRVEYAGAAYHVMARGNQGDVIFQDDRDRRRFLETLAQKAIQEAERKLAQEQAEKKLLSECRKMADKELKQEWGEIHKVKDFMKGVSPRIMTVVGYKLWEGKWQQYRHLLLPCQFALGGADCLCEQRHGDDDHHQTIRLPEPVEGDILLIAS